MKISVITVVYNGCQTVRAAIESVLNQKYPDIEYIIIDGGSTDGTLELIRSYGSHINKMISEKDNGIYDAMNKGLALATGEVVSFLNADDLYVDDQVIGKVARVFQENKIDSCYGDIYYVDRKEPDRVIRHWKARPFQEGIFKKGWYPAHPAFFVRKDIIDKYGGFDTFFKISADYELILRLLGKYRISTIYLPEILVKMRVGGESNRSIINIIKANIECYQAWKKNGLKPNIMYIFNKLWFKAKQYRK